MIYAILQTAKDHNNDFYVKLFQLFNLCYDDLNKVTFGKKFIAKIESLGIPPGLQVMAAQSLGDKEEEKKSVNEQ